MSQISLKLTRSIGSSLTRPTSNPGYTCIVIICSKNSKTLNFDVFVFVVVSETTVYFPCYQKILNEYKNDVENLCPSFPYTEALRKSGLDRLDYTVVIWSHKACSEKLKTKNIHSITYSLLVFCCSSRSMTPMSHHWDTSQTSVFSSFLCCFVSLAYVAHQL